jgi:rod shape determining protein RodA
MVHENNRLKLDYVIIFIIFCFAVISVYTLYFIQPYLGADIKSNLYIMQIAWYILGSMVAAAMLILDYDRFRKVAWILYGFGVLLMAGLYILPEDISLVIYGARGWYQIPGLGQTIQPVEFVKIFLLIAVANVITSHNEKKQESSIKDDLWLLGKILLVAMPPILLTAGLPDLGSAIVLFCIVAFLILVSGIRWRILLSIIGITVVTVGAFIGLYLLFPDVVKNTLNETIFQHVLVRLEAFFDPQANDAGSAYQLKNALLAIGSGQLLGKGFTEMEVYVPVLESDFIFAAIAEQSGFIGSSIVITLFFLLIYRIILIALNCKDPFGSYICAGVVGMITYQVIQNIGMTLKIMPITGLPLPFISYGGSSLLAFMMAIGLVLNVRSRMKTYMFDD